MHIRNAPTQEMREWGYGAEYLYDPDEPEGLACQNYLPDSIAGSRFYEPGTFGFEKEIAKRLEWWERQRSNRGVTGDRAAASGHEPERSG